MKPGTTEISINECLRDLLGPEKKSETVEKPTNFVISDVLVYERVLSAKQAAALYGVSIATWRRMQWNQKIPPPMKVSDRRLGWRVRDLIEDLKKRANAAA
jgi:predicted DNA-binding transcriptional regulator AlpA